MGEVVDFAAVIEAAAAIHHVRNGGGIERGGELGNHFGIAHQDSNILECKIRELQNAARDRLSLHRQVGGGNHLHGIVRCVFEFPAGDEGAIFNSRSPRGDGFHGAQNVGAAAEVVHQLNQVAAARRDIVAVGGKA